MSWDILGPLKWRTLQAPNTWTCCEFRCKSGSHGGTSITMTWGPRMVLGTEFLSAKAISKTRLSIDGTNMEKTPFIDDLGVAFGHQ